MGYLTAFGLAEDLDLDTGLSIHLQTNHYPSVPQSMVGPCKEALYAYLDEDYDREIELPAPITYRGSATAPARAIFDQHHLQPFLETMLGGEE